MKKRRTFIAISVPTSILRAAVGLQKRIGDGLDFVRWETEGNLHITLHFLGDVEELMVPDVCACAQEATALFEPFMLHVRGVGAFPDLDRPRTLWLGVTEGREALCELHAAIDKNLVRLPVRRETRTYQPHLTLGRVQGKQHVLDALYPRMIEHAESVAGEMLVEKATIFASETTRQGSKYHLLGSAVLGL